MTTYRSEPMSATPANDATTSSAVFSRRERSAPLVAKRCAWGLAVFMVVLPLQWYSPASGPLGNVRYFHIAAVFMLLIARPTKSSLLAAVRMARPVFPAAAMVVVLGTCTSIGWHSGTTQYIQAGYYVFFGLIAAGCLIIALTDNDAQRILAFAAPATVIVFVIALTISAHHAGVNIVSAISQAMGGNPSVLEFGVFRSAFATVAEDARSNLRHEIFGALVVTCYVGLVASGRSGYARKTIFATTVVTAILVVLSLSRSVILGVALTALVGVLRLMIVSRIKVGTFLVGLVGLAIIPLAIIKVLPLLSARVTETSSYDTRIAAVGQLSSDFGTRLFVGGPVPDVSTQNLVLDAVLRAGLVAGIAALAMEVVFIALGMRAISLYFRTGQVQALAVVGAAMQLFVRTLTGGQNLMHQVQWFALALIIAVLYLELGESQPKGLFGRRQSESWRARLSISDPASGAP